MGRVRVLLADDHEICCMGFKKLLEPEHEVVACVGDGHSVVKAALELKPDVIVLDVGMPLLNGLDAGREIKRVLPRTKLIFLTMNPDAGLATEAFGLGASGFLLKTSHVWELPKAIRDSLEGSCYITPRVRRAMDEAYIRDPEASAHPRDLTPRQREILQLLAEGKSMKEIAYILKVTHRTVCFHKYRIMEGLGITTNAEVVQYAMRHHMVSSVEHQAELEHYSS